MAGTACFSLVAGGIQPTDQRPPGLVELFVGSIAAGPQARPRRRSLPPRILTFTRKPDVSSFEPPGAGGRYTSITWIPFLRSSSVNSWVARLSVIKRRIL